MLLTKVNFLLALQIYLKIMKFESLTKSMKNYKLKMVWRKQLHGVKQDRSEPESPDDGVWRVEVDVGQNVGHRVVDDVAQAGKAVHQQSNTLGCHSWRSRNLLKSLFALWSVTETS